MRRAMTAVVVAMAWMAWMQNGAVPAQAQTPTPVVAIDVTALSDGSYVLTKVGGNVSLRPLQLIVPNVGPTPPPPPVDPQVLTARAKAFAAETKKVQPPDLANGAAIGALYLQLAKAARAGQIADGATLGTATKAATDLLLAGKAAPWTGVRQLLSDEWGKLQQAGASVPAYADLLEDAAAGIESASPRNIDPAVLAMILEIVKLILAIFIKPIP